MAHFMPRPCGPRVPVIAVLSGARSRFPTTEYFGVSRLSRRLLSPRRSRSFKDRSRTGTPWKNSPPVTSTARTVPASARTHNRPLDAAHQVDRLVLSGFTLKLTKSIMSEADYPALIHYSLWRDAKPDGTFPCSDLQHCCRTANRKAVLSPNSSMPFIA